ncbi:MAG: hypothetical protein WC389_18610 [Lutibacter sp.]|jgi:hypothetical protein
MKKENENPVVYRDANYENQVRKDLESSKVALQSVLDVWNSLELIPCTDIYQLIFNPQKIYSDAINKLAIVPVTAGRFQVSKQAFINTLDIPIPDQLYRAAKQARQLLGGVPGLWAIENNEVIMVEDEASVLIEKNNVYASGKKQIEFAEKLNSFISTLNELNELTGGTLLNHQFAFQYWNGKIQLIETDDRHRKAVLIPEVLKVWLSNIK